jgi:hypothetical protein
MPAGDGVPSGGDPESLTSRITVWMRAAFPPRVRAVVRALRGDLHVNLTATQRDLLLSLPDRLPLSRVDRLWVFAPHHGRSRESGLLVASLLPHPGGDPAQRTLVTLRYRAEQVKGRLHREDSISEEGSAPAERIERVIAGVLARSGEQSADPLVETIGGSEERWATFLEGLALRLDPVSQ